MTAVVYGTLPLLTAASTTVKQLAAFRHETGLTLPVVSSGGDWGPGLVFCAPDVD